MSVRIINADVMEGLRQLPDESVHCVVTSPPYWGLRDYGVEGQIGLEATPEQFVSRMVEVFREVRRVLRGDGTLWLNLGDSYNNRTRVRSSSHQPGLNGITDGSWAERANGGGVRMSHGMGLKEKDLVGAPWAVAFALREDGWWLRSDIIWSKPNPMPESVTDRPTKAHEYVFLLTKSERYFYDAEAIRETATYDGPNSPGSIASPYGQGFTRKAAEDRRRIGAKGNANGFRGGAYCNGATFDNAEGGKRTQRGNRKQDGHENRRYAGFNDRWDASEADGTAPLSRNKRSVWTIATAPFAEAHFATFPPELPEICIKAGCPKGGTVLDPFGGAGTTGLVADRLQRNAILIELNPEYAAMAERRINGDRGALLDLMEPSPAT
jgi:DNA modification methylase